MRGADAASVRYVAGKVSEVGGTTFSEEAWQHAFQLVEKVRSEKYLF